MYSVYRFQMYNRYRFQMYKVTIASFDGAKVLLFS